ncbi:MULTISPECIES: Yip1 family protein [unclassified Streptomyces]|uniref:Yip1 family protein n=1 Tax=unclassified Streptomyces TaxID=2593676 RepID=UPI0011634646|nr:MULTISPECIES: Yip1 family protein [unclassified Streptomyces]NMI59785.1 YIP1 family protein [Streptomyces sp. RLA2-12]QDN59025.1 YIP1 family protein [Streptomyces sp. S1D4-20]QDN69090.1 YIP1 family protein [Streptomyces sp. S1D4-14]QDO51508.1 YIP1 family protein [Streptomyces sp. RLB3-5]QDO61746.1 YIP1 family protein [Streptomyces sp. RLB1-8]
MSQLGPKPPSDGPHPARHSAGPGTFDYVAGFRIGRGRDDRAPQARPQQHRPSYGQQAPQGGQQPYGYPPAPSQQQPYGGQQYGGGRQYSGGQPGWPQANGGGAGGHGEPEYFGDGHPQQGPDPYAADSPGHTQAFSVGEDPYTQGGTYRAGQAAAPPIGPRLHWKDLLRGIVTAPNQTFLQMRDYTMWAPALIVTFLYGLLAVFGFDGARKDAINATLSNAVPIVLTTAVAIVISTFILGVVTHTLARQLGGDGAWQPTVGLSMLIMSITDTPRLIVAMFFGGDASFVQLLGWATWVAAGALLTLVVSRSHDLPWPKALAASAIQLIAILSIIKLGTF